MIPNPAYWAAPESSTSLCARTAKRTARVSPLDTRTSRLVEYAPAAPSPALLLSDFSFSPTAQTMTQPYIVYSPSLENTANLPATGYDFNGTFNQIQAGPAPYQDYLVFASGSTPAASDHQPLTPASAHDNDLLNGLNNYSAVDPPSPISPVGRRNSKASNSGAGKTRPRTAQRKAESRYRSSMHDLWIELQESVQHGSGDTMTKPDILRAAIVQLKQFNAS